VKIDSILLVEPDERLRKSYTRAMEYAGRNVFAFPTVSAMLDWVSPQHRNSIFILNDPPSELGYTEIVDEFRRRTELPNDMPVTWIAVTDDTERNSLEFLTLTGASFLLRRPLSVRLLLDVIDAIESSFVRNNENNGSSDAPIFGMPTQAKNIIDSIGIGVISVLEDGRIIFANRSAIISLGLESSQIQDVPLRDVFGAEAEELILNSPISSFIVSRELHVETLRGPMIIESSLTELRNESGDVCGRTIVFHDLTQLHRLEEAVHMFSRSILDSLYSGVITIDLNGRLEFMNKAAREIMGMTNDIVFGSTLASIFGESIAMEIMQHAGEEKPWRTYELAFDMNYNRIQIGYSVTTRTNRLGRKVGTVIHFRDISLIKHMQEERIRLEQLASMEILASALAHDIRNPLASISGMTQLIEMKLDKTHTAVEMLHRITSQVQRLNRLFQSFFAAIRVSREQPELVKVAAIYEQAVELMSSRITVKKLKVKFVESANQVTVFVNPDQFLQILLNLLVHAIDSVDANGEIMIEASPLDGLSLPEPEQVLMLEALRQNYSGSGTVVRVNDNGPKSSPEILARLFDPFFRAEAGGTDIGLFAVQRLVQKNGGVITPYRFEEWNRISLLLPSIPINLEE